MRFHLDAPLRTDDLAVRGSPEGWRVWWPGAEVPAPGQVAVVVRSFRPLRARLAVRSSPDRIDVGLIEGDLSSFSACIVREPGIEPPRLRADLDVVFPVAIPGALQHDVVAWIRRRLQILGDPTVESP